MFSDLFSKVGKDLMEKAAVPQRPIKDLDVCGTFSAVVKTIIRDGERKSPRTIEHSSGAVILHICLLILDDLPEVAGASIWDSIVIFPKKMEDNTAWREKAAGTINRAIQKLITLSGDERLSKNDPAVFEEVTGCNRDSHLLDKKVVIEVNLNKNNKLEVTKIRPYTPNFVPEIATVTVSEN